MRSCVIGRIVAITVPVLALACSTRSEGGGTGSETDTDTSTGSDTGGGDDGSDGSATDGTGDTGGGDGGDTPCVPGQSVPCACPDGSTGAQVCADDGQSFGPCECDGGDDGTGDDGGTTDTGSTGGGSCEDPGPEPNEDEANAVPKPEAGCDAEPGDIVGVLNEDQDTDWFSYHGVWDCGAGDALPAVTLDAADGELRLCVFAECDQGEADVECQEGDPATSPAGFPGCCTEPDGAPLGQLNCTNTDDESALVYVRVDHGGAGVCTGYTLGYSF